MAFLLVVTMNDSMTGWLGSLQAQQAPAAPAERCRDEIDRAVASVKRSAYDRWWRRQFYRETARIARANGWRKRHGRWFRTEGDRVGLGAHRGEAW